MCNPWHCQLYERLRGALGLRSWLPVDTAVASCRAAAKDAPRNSLAPHMSCTKSDVKNLHTNHFHDALSTHNLSCQRRKRELVKHPVRLYLLPLALLASHSCCSPEDAS